MIDPSYSPKKGQDCIAKSQHTPDFASEPHHTIKLHIILSQKQFFRRGQIWRFRGIAGEEPSHHDTSITSTYGGYISKYLLLFLLLHVIHVDVIVRVRIRFDVVDAIAIDGRELTGVNRHTLINPDKDGTVFADALHGLDCIPGGVDLKNLHGAIFTVNDHQHFSTGLY